MNGLFGLELPTSVNFVIAFVVVLALIGAATWLVRRFGAPRLDAGARNRQPRLAVLDSAAIDVDVRDTRGFAARGVRSAAVTAFRGTGECPSRGVDACPNCGQPVLRPGALQVAAISRAHR